MNMNGRTNVSLLIVTAVFAALLAVMSQLSIPMPSGVPVTLQTFAVALCHVCGVVQFCLVSGNGLIPSFLIASAPYLVKDVLSVAAAWFLAGVLKNSLSRAGIAWVRSIK